MERKFTEETTKVQNQKKSVEDSLAQIQQNHQNLLNEMRLQHRSALEALHRDMDTKLLGWEQKRTDQL